MTASLAAATGHVGVFEIAAQRVGRDFGDVSPLRGVILGGGSHQLSVTVAVEPIGENAMAMAARNPSTSAERT